MERQDGTGETPAFCTRTWFWLHGHKPCVANPRAQNSYDAGMMVTNLALAAMQRRLQMEVFFLRATGLVEYTHV